MSPKLQLLLVEDNPPDAEIVARHLSRGSLDFAIHRVETESAFLGALSTTNPHLIISDFQLPQFSGMKALEIASVHAPETPFIFVSGTIGEERAIEALRRGATDYVLKSNLARLLPAVQRALREAEIKSNARAADAQRREQEVRLHRLTRSYRMLSSTGSAILRLRDRAELLDEVCRIAAEQGGYDRVIIHLADANAKSLIPQASAGGASASLRASEIASLDGLPEESGMAARAVHSRVPEIVNDVGADVELAVPGRWWHRQGWQAAAALPLLIDGTAVGAMTLLSAQPDVFDQAEMGVLLELTANLCFALQYLDKDEALHFLAYFDALTSLAKRHLFCQRLAKLMAPGESRLLTVMVFDVQKLGTINDSLGRYVGDRLIEGIAARIKLRYQNSECASYFGGGTFALALRGVCDGHNADDVARLLQASVGQLFVEPFRIGGQELRPAIRTGVAFHPEDGSTADALVQNAEAALKAAREDNEKYLMYAMVTQRPTSRSVALETRLAGALDRREFMLHYQPKVDIATGRIVGLEALLRWNDAQSGLVSPAIFVPLLERSGAIVEVGEWVLEQSAQDCRTWLRAAPIRVAVNVSPLQLRRRDFVTTVLSRVAPPGGQDAHIDIEITESMLMQDIELSIGKLEELRQAGIGVAIDDFGTGYSSLRLLSRLPVDTLKIDRSFIQGIVDTPHTMTLVSTVVSLANAFDMQLVAEGVETVAQLDLLRAMGCHQAQGFYLGRPTPAAEVPAAIARLSPPLAGAAVNFAAPKAADAGRR
ncbi:MAG TPA: EAL domain-containing protein [Steroidobacteraceae bacterium]|jgi:diguanylate cyclase (GGDEF)-like protein|nr:EAL domain-containing protein [Steroidobacteraceae bacterium]